MLVKKADDRPLARPMGSDPGGRGLCKVPRGPRCSSTSSPSSGLSERCSPAHTGSQAPFQMGPFAAGSVPCCLRLGMCVWFCNSSETGESLRIANPTCYQSMTVFGLVLLTEDADVTKTWALVLQTHVQHGQPYVFHTHLPFGLALLFLPLGRSSFMVSGKG